MAVQIQFRRDTGANWSSASTVLAAGEMGIDLTEDKFKIGDGTTAWDDLDYAADFTGVTATADELNFVDGVTSAIQTQLNNKAPLASPTFTGTPTLPTGTIATTQTAADNSTKLATTAYVETAVAGIVDSAPATLNTLNELADALGDDANFATTLTTSLGLKANLASPTFTGTVILPSGTVTSAMILDGTIVNADVSASASIADTKLATISTASKVSNSATTATDANTASAIVARDASGNFAAGTVTAALTGNASTATTLATARTIAGQSFDGSASISIAPTDLTGVTSTAAELNILDGATLTVTELNYVDGVTSAIQNQIDLKAPSASPTFTGTVTVPTPTNNTDAATKAYVDDEVAGATINTLDEIGDVTITSASAGDFLKFNGSAFVNDAINLGTDTVGSFVESLTAGTGITLTNNSGEAATPTIAIGQAVGTSASVSFAQVTADLVGNSSTATLLQTARNIAGQSFNGSANISIAPTDLTGVTSTAAELNILDGATLTVTELNYVDGVTSAIQTQIDTKAAISGQTFTGVINTPNNTASMIPFYYANVAAFPAANNSHGAFAHSHATGLMYYAHGGNWIELANLASPTFTGTPTLPTGTIATTQTALNSTTAVATTAFVTSAVAAVSVDFSSDQNILANAVFG